MEKREKKKRVRERGRERVRKNKRKKKTQRKRRNTAAASAARNRTLPNVEEERRSRRMRGNYGRADTHDARPHYMQAVTQSRSADPPFRNLSAGIDAIARHRAI